MRFFLKVTMKKRLSAVNFTSYQVGSFVSVNVAGYV
jgi:hypothetical protein